MHITQNLHSYTSRFSTHHFAWIWLPSTVIHTCCSVRSSEHQVRRTAEIESSRQITVDYHSVSGVISSWWKWISTVVYTQNVSIIVNSKPTLCVMHHFVKFRFHKLLTLIFITLPISVDYVYIAILNWIKVELPLPPPSSPAPFLPMSIIILLLLCYSHVSSSLRG